MSSRNFRKLLETQWADGKFVCVGLDSEFGKIPEFVRRDTVGIANAIVAFNRAIVEATKDIALAYKPNLAFYEEHGSEGMSAFQRTIADINAIAPKVPVIADGKRADIGNTNNGYVASMFEVMQADACTVHPYLGAEALQPFLARSEKGIIVLCRTSNPGAGEFQDMDVAGDMVPSGYMPLYKYVAYRVSSVWNKNYNCALVVGATYSKELREVRELVGNMPILIPGVGFQQKGVPIETQVEQVVSAGKDSKGQGMIVNSSRGIIFASNGEDFAEVARRETQKLHNLINRYR